MTCLDCIYSREAKEELYYTNKGAVILIECVAEIMPQPINNRAEKPCRHFHTKYYPKGAE